MKTAYLDCISMCLFASLRSLSLIQTHLFLSFLVRDICAFVCLYSKVLLSGFSFKVLPYWTYSPSVCVLLQTQTLRASLVPPLIHIQPKTGHKVLRARYSLSLPLKSARVSFKTFRRYLPLLVLWDSRDKLNFAVLRE